VAFITTSFAMPSLQLPSRERLAFYSARAIALALWAVALAYTAGRLARIGFEWARPYLAKALHALALSLDGGLAYPDQPEPDPTPEPPDSIERYTNPVTGGVYVLGTRELIASSRPRARQRKSRAAAEAA
jgi:hypothetical protein